MSDLNKTKYQGVDRRNTRPEQPGQQPQKTGGRHGAITNNLYNWHSYKSWADKAKGNFDEKK